MDTLQSKAVLDVARENLSYYDHLLDVSRDRLKAGDIAQIDLDRLELQRVQYQSDLQTAQVNLRTAKIQLLLMLLNDRTPVEQFDVTGNFDFTTRSCRWRNSAKLRWTPSRPASRGAGRGQGEDRPSTGAGQRFDRSNLRLDFGRNPPIDPYFGVSMNIPLRIFDRNQGEKRRTQLEIDRSQRLLEAAQVQVFSDVDSAYAAIESNLSLLLPYRQKYLQQAMRVRDTVAFAYQHGGASLLDFLNAQSEYRSVQLSYVSLIGSYLTAASQLNLAVGREVVQ